MATLPQLSLVFLGGAIGGAARYGSMRLGTWLGGRASTALVFVNLVGCVAAGIAAALVRDPDAQRVLIGGFLGGYTTFSAVALECTSRGADRRRPWIDAALSIVLALPAFQLGFLAAGGER